MYSAAKFARQLPAIGPALRLDQYSACLLGAALVTVAATLPSVADPGSGWAWFANGAAGLVYVLALALHARRALVSAAAGVAILCWVGGPILAGHFPLAAGGGMVPFIILALPVLTGCLPLATNVAIVAAATVLPPALAAAGFAPGVVIADFVAQVMPAAAVALATLALLARGHSDTQRHCAMNRDVNARLRAVVTHLPGIAYVGRYDQDGLVGIDWTATGDLALPPGHDRSPMACYHPEDYPLFAEAHAALQRSGRARLRARLNSAGDGWRWVEHRLSVNGRHGAALVVEGLLLDVDAEMDARAEAITQREERRRIALLEMENRNMVALGKVTGSFAHEFNNLLGMVIGFGELVVEATDPTHAAHRYGQNIVAAGQRGKALVDQLSPLVRRDSEQACEVLVPFRTAPVDVAPQPEAGEPDMLGRVLVVDDDVDGCDMVAEALRRLGWTVEACRSPLEAVERIAHQGPWDAVVTDQMMPGMKGTELIRKAAELQPRLPCVLCSGYDKSLIEADVASTGAVAVLRKPFSIRELHAHLLNHRGGRGTQAGELLQRRA